MKGIAFCIRFSEKQANYLRQVKAEHKISVTGQLRTLVRNEMYGIGLTAAGHRNHKTDSGKKRTRPVTTGNPAYAKCVRELSKIFKEKQRSKR